MLGSLPNIVQKLYCPKGHADSAVQAEVQRANEVCNIIIYRQQLSNRLNGGTVLETDGILELVMLHLLITDF